MVDDGIAAKAPFVPYASAISADGLVVGRSCPDCGHLATPTSDDPDAQDGYVDHYIDAHWTGEQRQITRQNAAEVVERAHQHDRIGALLEAIDQAAELIDEFARDPEEKLSAEFLDEGSMALIDLGEAEASLSGLVGDIEADQLEHGEPELVAAEAALQAAREYISHYDITEADERERAVIALIDEILLSSSPIRQEPPARNADELRQISGSRILPRG